MLNFRLTCFEGFLMVGNIDFLFLLFCFVEGHGTLFWLHSWPSCK